MSTQMLKGKRYYIVPQAHSFIQYYENALMNVNFILGKPNIYQFCRDNYLQQYKNLVHNEYIHSLQFIKDNDIYQYRRVLRTLEKKRARRI